MTHFIIGRITKPHGLKGLMKLQSLSSQDFFSYPEFFDAEGTKLTLFHESALKGNMYIISIPGVNSITMAKAYLGKEIWGRRQPLEEGEFYMKDLIGLDVYDEEQNLIGIIDAIQDFGASPFIQIKKDDGKIINAFFHKDAIVEIKDNAVILHKEFILI